MPVSLQSFITSVLPLQLDVELFGWHSGWRVCFFFFNFFLFAPTYPSVLGHLGAQ